MCHQKVKYYIFRVVFFSFFLKHTKKCFLKISTKADESYNDQMDVGTTDVTSGQKTSLFACLLTFFEKVFLSK